MSQVESVNHQVLEATSEPPLSSGSEAQQPSSDLIMSEPESEQPCGGDVQLPPGARVKSEPESEQPSGDQVGVDQTPTTDIRCEPTTTIESTTSVVFVQTADVAVETQEVSSTKNEDNQQEESQQGRKDNNQDQHQHQHHDKTSQHQQHHHQKGHLSKQHSTRSSSSRRPSYGQNTGRVYASGYQNYGLAYLPYKSNFEPSEDAKRRADEFLQTLKL